MLPSGLRAKTSEPPMTGEVKIRQKIFLGDCLLELQCPSNILSILRNQMESIDTFFPLVRKKKRKKEVELESQEVPKKGECIWKSYKYSCKKSMIFDILANRCGEGDRDHAVITTVFLIDDRDISLEPCVLLLRYDHVHLDGHWSLCRGEALTGRRFERPRPPCQGIVHGPVQQRVVIPDVHHLETAMHSRPWFDV